MVLLLKSATSNHPCLSIDTPKGCEKRAATPRPSAKPACTTEKRIFFQEKGKRKEKKRKEKKRKEKKRCHPETIREVRLYETGCVLLFGKSKKK